MELCSICKDEMTLEQNYMLSCNHRFHTSCIIDSLRRNPECPICRDTGAVKIYNDTNFSVDNNIYNNYIDSEHSDFCVHCSIKNKQNNFYDIYSTLYEIINNDEILFSKKNIAVKSSNQIRKKIFKLNNRVKIDISQLYKDTLSQIDTYYNNKTHSIEFMDILDNTSKNKPLAQQFGKLLLDKLHELDINKDSDVIMVINYITYELYNCSFIKKDKFVTCYKNIFRNKFYYNKLLTISKKNKTVNNTKINIIE